jgi:hypothetical protein
MRRVWFLLPHQRRRGEIGARACRKRGDRVEQRALIGRRAAAETLTLSGVSGAWLKPENPYGSRTKNTGGLSLNGTAIDFAHGKP